MIFPFLFFCFFFSFYRLNFFIFCVFICVFPVFLLFFLFQFSVFVFSFFSTSCSPCSFSRLACALSIVGKPVQTSQPCRSNCCACFHLLASSAARAAIARSGVGHGHNGAASVLLARLILLFSSDPVVLQGHGPVAGLSDLAFCALARHDLPATSLLRRGCDRFLVKCFLIKRFEWRKKTRGVRWFIFIGSGLMVSVFVRLRMGRESAWNADL